MTQKKSKGNNKSAKQKKQIKREVIEILNDNGSKGMNYKQLSSKLGLQKEKERQKLLKIIEELYLDGYLREEKPGKYKSKLNVSEVEGYLHLLKQGFAFVDVEAFDEDVFIPPDKTKNALSGDKVKVKIIKSKKDKSKEGEVIEVLERHKIQYVGTLEVSDKFAFLIPDARNIDVDIFIPLKKLNNGASGQKVMAEINEWPEGAKSPYGEVKEILGEAGDHTTEMNAIIYEFNLPTDFPNEVLEEANATSEQIDPQTIENRKDFREVTTFTIDPEDAKDYDDALSLQIFEDGTYEVGIHIADVTHYVQTGTKLDEEAFNRATSVYLVDRVIPMLPEKLSNKLCSLRPEEEKLSFSAVFHLDGNANILNEWYGKTIIKSDKRFVYEDAQDLIEQEEGAFAEELKTLNHLAKVLRKHRFEEGAIAFETEEVKFLMDEEGKPFDIIKKVRKDAHLLIEDFMLLANRKVAEFIFNKQESFKETPFVYRVHDAPPPDKLENFVKIANRFGYELNTNNNKTISASFNTLLENLEGKPEKNMMESLAIRTMSKAFYTTKKGGHYGLAFDYYTHFTSPIRRYPDVIAHRLLQQYLIGQYDDVKQEAIEKLCKHSSEMEIRAEEAERASIQFKQIEYMTQFIGDEFEAIISGVTDSTLFVEITENKCEGRIPLSSLIDDYYFFEGENYLLRGVNTGKVFQLGDEAKIRVMEADPVRRKLIFDMV